MTDSKTLVVYHSVQGHTEKVAKTLAGILDADLFKINTDQISSGSAVMRTPRILAQMYGVQSFDSSKIDIGPYNTVLIGSPCWMYEVTRPVKAFVKSHDFRDKKVGLFITHGGDYGETSGKFKLLLTQGKYLGMLDYQSVNGDLKKRLKKDIMKFSALERTR